MNYETYETDDRKEPLGFWGSVTWIALITFCFWFWKMIFFDLAPWLLKHI